MANFRIESVQSHGHTGRKAKIRYYDTETNEFFEKTDYYEYLTTTIEIVMGKHGTPHQVIQGLEEKYPEFKGQFKVKPYTSSKKDSLISILTGATESFIVHHYGDQEDKYSLEYYVGEKNRQIFIRNRKDSYKARTTAIPENTQTAQRLTKGKQILEEKLSGIGIPSTSIKIKPNLKCIEAMCTEKQLYELPGYFRVNVLESKKLFESENQASEFLDRISKTPGFPEHADKTIISEAEEGAQIKYKLKICVDEQYIEILERKGFRKAVKDNKQLRSAREEKDDPLGLSMPRHQLNFFFPSHIPYDPEKPLMEQKNTEKHPFPESELERVVEDAVNAYIANTASIDLEVMDYDEEELISGTISMVILKSEKENKLYITKEGYKKHKEKIGSRENKAEIIFVEDEKSLISKLNEDAEKYMYITGHNFDGYDWKHLTKHNTKNKKLWTISNKRNLDTLTYSKNRVDILADNKLGTLAGFQKTLEHHELKKLFESEKYEDLCKLIDYTVEDGEKTWGFTKQIIKNAVIESITASASLRSVFANKPVKLYHDSGQRTYFLATNTFRDRHEMSPKRNLEKLFDRSTPDEIITNLLENIDMKKGSLTGEFCYPSLFFDSYRESIENNPCKKFLYEQALSEKNPFLKADLLNKLSSWLLVMVDKNRQHLEDAGLKFGEKHEPDEVFTSLKKENEDNAYEKFLEESEERLSDHKLSQTSLVFSAEYDVKPNLVELYGLPYMTTMLDFNNKLAEKLETLKRKGITGKAGKYLVGPGEGIPLGELERGVLLPSGRFAGLLKGLDGKEHLIYQFFKRPKNKVVRDILECHLKGQPYSFEDAMNLINSNLKSEKDRKNTVNREVISALYKVDIARDAGTQDLFA